MPLHVPAGGIHSYHYALMAAVAVRVVVSVLSREGPNTCSQCPSCSDRHDGKWNTLGTAPDCHTARIAMQITRQCCRQIPPPLPFPVIAISNFIANCTSMQSVAV
jgi:hypothetical protein